MPLNIDSNYPQIVGTCPGHPGQLISQNCVLPKIRVEPPPERVTVNSGLLMALLRYLGRLFLKFFIDKLRLFAHVVGSPSHKGIARRALPASGVKMQRGEVVGWERFRFRVQEFLCNARLVFFIRVRNLFVFRAYPTMRVRLCLLNMSSVFEWYVWVGIVSPDLWVGWALTNEVSHC